jgi:hypothetical protein
MDWVDVATVVATPLAEAALCEARSTSRVCGRPAAAHRVDHRDAVDQII